MAKISEKITSSISAWLWDGEQWKMMWNYVKGGSGCGTGDSRPYRGTEPEPLQYRIGPFPFEREFVSCWLSAHVVRTKLSANTVTKEAPHFIIVMTGMWTLPYMFTVSYVWPSQSASAMAAPIATTWRHCLCDTIIASPTDSIALLISHAPCPRRRLADHNISQDFARS